MYHKELCKPFREKVDPIKDGAPDYFLIISKPMDLGTIKRKLQNNEYASVQEWIDDVELIWQNSMIYNNEGSILHVMALELQGWFQNKIKSMPRSKDEEWFHSMQKVTKKMIFLAEHAPPSITSNHQIRTKEVSSSYE